MDLVSAFLTVILSCTKIFNCNTNPSIFANLKKKIKFHTAHSEYVILNSLRLNPQITFGMVLLILLVELLCFSSTESIHRFLSSRPPANESRFLCLGGEDDIYFPADSRHCAFKNVCYNKTDGQWLYFTGLDDIQVPLLANIGDLTCQSNCGGDPSFTTTFYTREKKEKRFIVADSVWYYKHVTPKVIKSGIPSSYYFVDGGKNAIHVYNNPFVVGDAMGHIISEGVYPIFHLMDLFGVTNLELYDIRLVLDSSPCNPMHHKCKSYFELIKSVTRMFRTEKDWIPTLNPVVPSPYNQEITCYEKLLAGMGHLHASSRVHHPESWTRYTDQVMYAMGFNPNAQLTSQKIMFINKGGKKGGAVKAGVNRVVLNHEEIVNKLRKTFGVIVTYWVWNGETLREEVENLQDITVCISVNGGTSVPCTFMPDGSSNVFLSTWYSEEYSGRPGTNNNMEHVTWTWDGKHKTYAYPVWLNETVPDRGIKKDNDYKYILQWKHNKGFTVNFDRLAPLVNEALKYAEDAYALGPKSFKRLKKEKVKSWY